MILDNFSKKHNNELLYNIHKLFSFNPFRTLYEYECKQFRDIFEKSSKNIWKCV